MSISTQASKTYSATTTTTRIGDSFIPSASGIKVAIFGLITSLITLGFTIAVQISTFRQTQVRIPLAQQTKLLHNLIGQSMTTLGAWLVRGDPSDRKRFETIWPDHIIPTLEALKKTSDEHFSTATRAQITSLTQKLSELERIQHLIADLAHAPGRIVAEETYEREIIPLNRFLLGVLDQALDQAIPYKLSPSTLNGLLKMKLAILEVQNALLDYLREPNQTHRHRLAIARQEALRVETQWAENAPNDEFTEGLKEALDRVLAYDQLLERLVTQRGHPDGNLYLVHFEQDLMPTLRALLAQTHALSHHQSQAMISSGRRLAQWSAVVVLLALITGILSAVNLYASLQTKHRVKRFAAKAERLGQYALGKRLGEGAVGTVYHAQHALLKRPTAIKILRPSQAQNFRAQERFRAEVQLTSQLTHPNTIDIFDYGRTNDGVFYYAMELLEGINLRTLVIETGPLPPNRMIFLIQQVCGSLGEAHNKALLHRDIKPSNIMLTERGGMYDTVKVVDFGLARPINHRDHPKQIEGTPMFLAPEVITDNNAASPRSDLYALGGVMYFLLTQKTIFDHQNPSKILRAHVEEPIVSPSARALRPIPYDIEAVINCCLAKNPQDRPESASHLATLLGECQVKPWTPEDAKMWWKDYGEALHGQPAQVGITTSDPRTPTDNDTTTI
ncbi:MAG: serine/threonine protein kinase [Myxococcales bacterium]|nr:serine/threonine protein kinase [Myxococcales bacterium]